MCFLSGTCYQVIDSYLICLSYWKVELMWVLFLRSRLVLSWYQTKVWAEAAKLTKVWTPVKLTTAKLKFGLLCQTKVWTPDDCQTKVWTPDSGPQISIYWRINIKGFNIINVLFIRYLLSSDWFVSDLSKLLKSRTDVSFIFKESASFELVPN